MVVNLRHLIVLFFLASFSPLEAQWHFGMRGGLNGSFLDYTQLHDQQQKIGLAGEAAIFFERCFIDKASVGVEASYARRNARLEFNTSYLLDYSTAGITNIAYMQSLGGLWIGLPVTWYFGRPQTRFDAYFRCYCFAEPSLFVVTNGSMEWIRKHLVDDQVIDDFRVPVSLSSSAAFEYGIRVGLGAAYNRKAFSIRCDLSFYYGLSDTFSEAEQQLEVAYYYGLGDIQHEVLGSRFVRQVGLSVSVVLPLKARPVDACWVVDC